MIKAAIFDLDGTLLNTLPSISYFGNEALKKFGFAEIERDAYRYLVGDGAPKLIRGMLEKVGGDPESDFDKVYTEYRTQYDARTSYKTSFYPGILEMLGTMRHYRLKTAIFSNKPQTQVDNVVKDFFPEDLFDVVYGAREDLPKKPDPTGIYRICEVLGVKPEECMYVGDSGTDMMTGVAAGCLTVGAGWGFRTIEELLTNGAYAVAEEPMELLQLI